MKDNGIPQSSYPRERLLHYGAEALSNQELLAILYERVLILSMSSN